MQAKEQFQSFRTDFIKFLHNSNQIEEESLEILKNLKIAISGSYLIHNIIVYSNINIFQGFSKYQISRYLKKLFDSFNHYHIKAIVVFEGIVYDKDTKSNFPEISQKVRNAWQSILENPKDPKIVQLLNDLLHYFFTELEISNILDECNIEYIHAPYFSISQMKWFVDYNYAHLVCCGLEGIVMNLNHIIVDFDLNNGKFYWLDVKKLQQKAMNLDAHRMMSLFLVHGYSPNIHTFIPIDYLKLRDSPPEEKEAKAGYCFDNIKAQITLNPNINQHVPEDQVNTYHNLRKKLDCILVINSDCEVNMISSSNSTSYDTVTEHFGPYLPPELYIFFVYNLIDRELIDSIANGHFIVRPPLSDSAEYHHHIDKFYKTMLERITGIFTAKLHQKFRNDSYNLIRFYFIDRSFPFKPKDYKPQKFILKQSFIDRVKIENQNKNKRIGFCRVLQYFTEYVRETEPTEQKRPGPGRKESLDFILTTKLSPLTKLVKNNSEEGGELMKESESPESSEKSLHSPAEPNLDQPQTSQEILSYLYLSFLEMYDYVNTENRNLMVIGGALRKCDENFEEALVMLLELMKPNLCLINGREFSNSKVRKNSTEAPFNTSDKREHNDREFYQINLWNSTTKDEEKEAIVLISRVFSLISPSISVNHAEANFSDYDYDLCQYLGVLKHVQKMLRFSFESLMLNTFFTHCSKKDIKIFLGWKKNLPFRNNLSVTLGVVIKKLLQTNETLQEFKEKNPQLINLDYDLKAGYVLWENVLFLLQYQENKGVAPIELVELFKTANELLNKRFKELFEI